MKALIVGVAALVLLFGAAPAFAQHQSHKGSKSGHTTRGTHQGSRVTRDGRGGSRGDGHHADRNDRRIDARVFGERFGRAHFFNIGTPVFFGGFPGFYFGGFGFAFVDPWPLAWAYTDGVYVDYVDDGYYLYNPTYPGVRIEIAVQP
jgi:hypothetical protein